MSELEIQRRKEYKRNRKRWKIIQLIAVILFAAIAIGSFVVYTRMNHTYYVEYTEKGDIDYKVQYTDNSFFESEWIEKDQSYISSLIKNMVADFTYQMKVESSDLTFDYQYQIDAKLLIASKDSGAPYYVYEENLLPQKQVSVTDKNVIKIDETISIDYVKYNGIANSFVQAYDLKNTASCTLLVTIDVDVLSSNTQFDKKNQNSYSTTLNIPLAVETFNIHRTSATVENETKVLEYTSIANRDIFAKLCVVSTCATILLTVILIVFLYLSRNEDITYAAKVQKILRTYSSYIQRIYGEFDEDGYQIVSIKSFVEMLGIRDTIQSPVLMSENRDETMTRFLIPTNTKILYVFEIKVDNYDAIYGTGEPFAPVILESVDEEELIEALAQPDVDLSKVEYVPDDDDQFEVADNEPGVEVIGVVWPEHPHRNKVYRYDPNGETLEKGDVVLVPTFDAGKNRNVLRKVAVAHENHRVDPEHLKHPLKKIVAIVKRAVEYSLTPLANKNAKLSSQSETEEEIEQIIT